MGSDSFSVPILVELLDSGSPIGVRVEGVVTQPDRPAGRGRKRAESPVKSLARQRGLPTVQPERLRDPESIEEVLALSPDLVVVASYGQILPRPLLEEPRFGALNLHPSLLPKYRGPSPIETAIIEGAAVTGTTLMLMTPKMDAGPILAQRQVTVDDNETAGELSIRLAGLSAKLLLEQLPSWIQRGIPPRPQDEAEATYTHLITKAEAHLDWQLPALQLARQVRAFNPWPAAFCFWQGRRLRILRARALNESRFEPGTVGAQEEGLLLIGTGEGTLAAQDLQLEGGKTLGADAFARGHRDVLGTTLQ